MGVGVSVGVGVGARWMSSEKMIKSRVWEWPWRCKAKEDWDSRRGDGWDSDTGECKSGCIRAAEGRVVDAGRGVRPVQGRDGGMEGCMGVLQPSGPAAQRWTYTVSSGRTQSGAKGRLRRDSPPTPRRPSSSVDWLRGREGFTWMTGCPPSSTSWTLQRYHCPWFLRLEYEVPRCLLVTAHTAHTAHTSPHSPHSPHWPHLSHQPACTRGSTCNILEHHTNRRQLTPNIHSILFPALSHSPLTCSPPLSS